MNNLFRADNRFIGIGERCPAAAATYAAILGWLYEDDTDLWLKKNLKNISGI